MNAANPTRASAPGLPRRVLLVGWDAADWQMIEPLLAQGLMPTLAGLLSRGAAGNLATTRPILSSILWNTIATGKRADAHGVLGFTEPDPDGAGIRTTASTSRRAKALWNILTQCGLRSNVIGWYASHPDDLRIDPAEAHAALEQLVALGYIEPLSEDAEKTRRDTIASNQMQLALSHADALEFAKAIAVIDGLGEAFRGSALVRLLRAQCLHGLRDFAGVRAELAALGGEQALGAPATLLLAAVELAEGDARGACPSRTDDGDGRRDRRLPRAPGPLPPCARHAAGGEGGPRGGARLRTRERRRPRHARRLRAAARGSRDGA
jgi:hypothetical protein